MPLIHIELIEGRTQEQLKNLVADVTDAVTKNTGAYGYTMASNYNRNPRPAVVFCEDGKSRLVVRRETYADMMACELGLED